MIYLREGIDKTNLFNPGQNIEESSQRPTNSPGMAALQRRSGRKKTTDPFGYIIYFYLILNLSLFFLLGWLYYSLDRKVVMLSEQLAAYEQKDAQAAVYPPFSETSGAEPLPSAALQAGVNDQNSLSDTSSGAVSSNSTAYTVELGDTWWDICQRFYGDGTYYHKLLVYNKMKKEDLKRGTIIQIPQKEELSALRTEQNPPA